LRRHPDTTTQTCTDTHGREASRPCPSVGVCVASPLGTLEARFSEKGLVRLEFSHRTPKAAQVGHKMVEQFRRELAAYFRGGANRFGTPLDLGSATPFAQRVWAELRRIPFGTTVSYAELARRVGSPRAARAVGQAVGANPIPILIPCHRVIRSDGGLGGFSAGPEIKKWLLRHEGSR